MGYNSKTRKSKTQQPHDNDTVIYHLFCCAKTVGNCSNNGAAIAAAAVAVAAVGDVQKRLGSPLKLTLTPSGL